MNGDLPGQVAGRLQMRDLLDNPAVQAGVAPLIVALVIATILLRWRVAWLAIIAGFATMVALSTGFSFTPLSASRKVLLLTLAAPLVGVVLDYARPRWPRVGGAVAIVFGLFAF